ncbi:tRNA-splicing endonuclease subunit [Coemansia sp. RSA 552]|nr:tRNA-splicing endonuclease subunit [Coemansia sp. RSA 552]
MEKVRLRCVNGQVMVTDADVVLSLRTKHRIVGSLEGTHPTNPQQNRYLSLPLFLLPEEAALLIAIDAVELEGDQFQWPQTDHDQLRFRLYRDFHNRGYYLTRGIKFGGDYLLYPGDPLRYHSSHVVSLLPNRTDKITPREIVTLGRVCTAVNKTRVLSSWNNDKDCFTHINLNWSGF